MTAEAVAGCPQGQEAFTSCQIEGHGTEVHVCFDDQIATYSYGPIGGTPDLFLSESIERLDFEPWSGLGTAISESVTFYNLEYGYNVGGGFERPFSEEEMQHPQRRFGWVEVTESSVRAASLECAPETVTYGFGGGLYDAKVAAGLTWDPYSYTWVSDLVQPAATSTLMEIRPFGVIEYCLGASEFRLGDTGMGDPLEALGKLGPSVVVNDPNGVGEDIKRMMLVGAHIDISQDMVIAMSTTSPDWQMPSGLRVGLTRGEVIRILGSLPNGYIATSREFSFHVCMKDPALDPKWTVLIDFGQDKRVEAIHLVSPSY